MPTEKYTPAPVSAILAEWYEIHRRALPWRESHDPYTIWISEVILQQTRVAQGLDYFYRFMARFPDVEALASADEDEVLKYWQGLGYYSRARSLHTAARQVMERFGGRFPTTYEDVLSLKGVGEYTAAAICSFAFEQPYAVVDGNVYRVLARLFGVDLPIDGGPGKRYFAALAQELLDLSHPGRHNQATMEFGALQCTPRSPDCAVCPLGDRCRARAEGRVGQLPVKAARTAVTSRWFNYLCIHCDGELLLSKRTGNDIWRNLYEFPLIETDAETDFSALLHTEAFQELMGSTGFTLTKTTKMPKHQLSHRTIHSTFYELAVDSFPPSFEKFLRVGEGALGDYAVSRLTEMYLERR